MSYILDALKKSEQQRQAVEPNSVSDRLLINQAEVKPRFKIWWTMLGVANIGAIALSSWYLMHDKSPMVTASSATHSPMASPAPVSASSSQPAAAPQTETSQAENTPEPNALSIAEMMATQQQEPANAGMTSQRQAKSGEEKKPAAAKKRLGPPGNLAYSRAEYGQEPFRPAGTSLPSFNPPGETAQSVTPASTRPKLAINVFGYAQNPEERFVIINMTKYKVGQQVHDGVELKAIHPDHIELQQDGVRFKMFRP